MMECILVAVWPEIDREYLQKLNKSILKRLELYIKNNGGATRY